MTENSNQDLKSLKKDDFLELLKLQELDTTIDQAKAKRESLPAHEAIKEVQNQALQLRPQMQQIIAERDEARTKQQELETQVQSIRKRVTEINNRLYDGSAKLAPNDALAMSHEVKQLDERVSDFETSELEIIEKLEDLEKRVGPLELQAQELSAKLTTAQAEIAKEQAQIDAELTGFANIRETIIPKIPQALINIYEQLRKRLGGLAVATFNGATCDGCHIAMAASEISQIKNAPDNAIIHCEECDRLLVRV